MRPDLAPVLYQGDDNQGRVDCVPSLLVPVRSWILRLLCNLQQKEKELSPLHALLGVFILRSTLDIFARRLPPNLLAIYKPRDFRAHYLDPHYFHFELLNNRS